MIKIETGKTREFKDLIDQWSVEIEEYDQESFFEKESTENDMGFNDFLKSLHVWPSYYYKIKFLYYALEMDRSDPCDVDVLIDHNTKEKLNHDEEAIINRLCEKLSEICRNNGLPKEFCDPANLKFCILNNLEAGQERRFLCDLCMGMNADLPTSQILLSKATLSQGFNILDENEFLTSLVMRFEDADRYRTFIALKTAYRFLLEQHENGEKESSLSELKNTTVFEDELNALEENSSIYSVFENNDLSSPPDHLNEMVRELILRQIELTGKDKIHRAETERENLIQELIQNSKKFFLDNPQAAFAVHGEVDITYHPAVRSMDPMEFRIRETDDYYYKNENKNEEEEKRRLNVFISESSIDVSGDRMMDIPVEGVTYEDGSVENCEIEKKYYIDQNDDYHWRTADPEVQREYGIDRIIVQKKIQARQEDDLHWIKDDKEKLKSTASKGILRVFMRKHAVFPKGVVFVYPRQGKNRYFVSTEEVRFPVVTAEVWCEKPVFNTKNRQHSEIAAFKEEISEFPAGKGIISVSNPAGIQKKDLPGQLPSMTVRMEYDPLVFKSTQCVKAELKIGDRIFYMESAEPVYAGAKKNLIIPIRGIDGSAKMPKADTEPVFRLCPEWFCAEPQKTFTVKSGSIRKHKRDEFRSGTIVTNDLPECKPGDVAVHVKKNEIQYLLCTYAEAGKITLLEMRCRRLNRIQKEEWTYFKNPEARKVKAGTSMKIRNGMIIGDLKVTGCDENKIAYGTLFVHYHREKATNHFELFFNQEEQTVPDNGSITVTGITDCSEPVRMDRKKDEWSSLMSEIDAISVIESSDPEWKLLVTCPVETKIPKGTKFVYQNSRGNRYYFISTSDSGNAVQDVTMATHDYLCEDLDLSECTLKPKDRGILSMAAQDSVMSPDWLALALDYMYGLTGSQDERLLAARGLSREKWFTNQILRKPDLMDRKVRRMDLITLKFFSMAYQNATDTNVPIDLYDDYMDAIDEILLRAGFLPYYMPDPYEHLLAYMMSRTDELVDAFRRLMITG